MRGRPIEGWLARLCDPRGINAAWPALPIAAADAAAFDRLFFELQRHNVHLAGFSNMIALIEESPQALIAGSAADIGEAASRIGAQLRERRLGLIGHNMMMAALARQVSQAIEGLPATIVKGIDFAEAAYGGVHLRGFSDVDVLVAPAARGAAGEALGRLGFTEITRPGKAGSHGEQQWGRHDPKAGALLVELHTDLVHAPELNRRMSLTWELYAGAGSGGVTPAARLVLAALHGASSHLFGRLQYVVDGLMLAGTGVDPGEMVGRAEASGALLPLRTMLRLAADLGGGSTCRALLEALPGAATDRLESRLIPLPTVLAAKSPGRWRLLPRRYLYRRLLRA